MKDLNQQKKAKQSGRNITLNLYECRCGNEVWALPHKVRGGHKKSCGCFLDDPGKFRNKFNPVLDGTRERDKFISMVQLWASTFTEGAA